MVLGSTFPRGLPLMLLFRILRKFEFNAGLERWGDFLLLFDASGVALKASLGNNRVPEHQNFTVPGNWVYTNFFLCFQVL